MPEDIKKVIAESHSANEISEAVEHEKRIRYFIETDISNVSINNEDYTARMIKDQTSALANLNPFLGWVMNVLRKENYNSFLKYYRKPLPTVALIQDNVIPELKKVFDAQNSYFDYDFSDQERKEVAVRLFNAEGQPDYIRKIVWPEYIYRPNSIVITDIGREIPARPYRYVIRIGDVIAIRVNQKDQITMILFNGKDAKTQEAKIYYYTEQSYSVYRKDADEYIFEYEAAHDLKRCPADFISNEPLNSEKKIIRKSIFSNYITKFEEYVFLHTLYKMLLPNGALPITTHYRQKKKPCEGSFADGTHCKEGYLANEHGWLGGKDDLISCPMCNPKTVIQAGSVIQMDDPITTMLKTRNISGQADAPLVDLNVNFLKFHYVPVDILTWLNNYLIGIEAEIIIKMTGNEIATSNEEAKNRDQVKAGMRSIRNALIFISGELSDLRKSIDEKYFTLLYAKSFLGAEISYGTEFYLDDVKSLLLLQATATNPIEFKNIQHRINETAYKNNREMLARVDLLYKLLPYENGKDFALAIDKGKIDPVNFELQTRFNNYISIFEAKYGNVVTFVSNFDETVTMDKRIDFIRNILKAFIPAPAIAPEPLPNPVIEPTINT